MNRLPPEITLWGPPRADYSLAVHRITERRRHPAPANDEYDAITRREATEYAWLAGIIAAATLAIGIVAWVL